MNRIGLAECCTKTQEKLKAFLKAELIERGYSPIEQDGFLYAEGELPVMLTAHMDTVHHDNCTIVRTSPDGKYWMSPQGIGGDDRCGIYAIMKVAETHKVSILFTEDEEVGCVGAKKYSKIVEADSNSELIPQNLNYIIEIDRKNANDAVFYDCDNKEFEAFVTAEDIGFKTASGSCSDISYVAPALGVAAVNLSSGYYNPHQTCEYINLEELHETIRRIKLIIEKPSEKFEYVEGRKKSYWSYDSWKSSSYSNYYGGYYGYAEEPTSPINFAFEDFVMGEGIINPESMIKTLDSISIHWSYLVHDNVKNQDFNYEPEDGDEEMYFFDKDFNVYMYDKDLNIMIDCEYTIKSKTFRSKSGNATPQEPYFAAYLAKKYYTIPANKYNDFYNYYQENREYYDDDYKDIPIDDDIEKKDELEEDILKLYN